MAKEKEVEDTVPGAEEEREIVIEDNAPEQEGEDTAPAGASGEIDSVAEDAAAKKPAKRTRSRGTDSQIRIKELWAKLNAETAEKEKYQNEASSARARAEKFEQITSGALQESLNNKKEFLTDKLAQAHEAADSKKIAEISTEISKVTSQISEIERYNIENNINARPQEGEERTQQPAPAAIPPAMQRWINENKDWYFSDGENYDEEKSQDVHQYSQNLERELTASGRAAEISTIAYFRKIDAYAKENWPDDGEDEVQEVSKAKTPSGRSAPVGNRTPPGQPRPGVKKEIRLTEAEKDMALAIDVRGPDGKMLTDSQKLVLWNKNKSTPPSGPISVKTLKGGY